MKKYFRIKTLLLLASLFSAPLAAAKSAGLSAYNVQNEILKAIAQTGVTSAKNYISPKASAGKSKFIEVGLEYPVNFGVHFKYLINESFYARLGLGFMPKAFLSAFENLAPSFGYLDKEEARLISKAFENSAYLDFRLAWSPYLKESGGGPYIELGLSGMFYGNGKIGGSSLSKVFTEGEPFDGTKTYSVKTNAYNASIHIGYQIPFERITFNLEAGLIKVLGAQMLPVKEGTAGGEAFSAPQEKNFTDFLEDKGWIFPTVSGWISIPF